MSCQGVLEKVKVSDYYEGSSGSILTIVAKGEDAFFATCKYWQQGLDTITISHDDANRNHVFKFGGFSLFEELNYMVEMSIDDKKFFTPVHSINLSNEIATDLPSFEILIDSMRNTNISIMLRKKLDPGCQLIIDHKGRVGWYMVSDSALQRPFSFSEGKVLSLTNPKEIAEVSLNGDTTLLLKMGENGFDKELHHEIIKNEQGHILALTYEYKDYDLSEVGGQKDHEVKGDGILVLDSLGNKIWEWSVFDHIDTTKKSALKRKAKDLVHANSLSIAPDSNYLVSFRDLNQIWKINSESGEVMWRLGDNGDFELNKDSYFYKQHAAHINQDGDLMIFDNGNPRLTGLSRALSFEIDEEGLVATRNLDVALPDSLFSFKQGSVYMLPKGNLLFCSSMSKKLAITNQSGDILWMAKSDDSFYRAIPVKDFGRL